MTAPTGEFYPRGRASTPVMFIYDTRIPGAAEMFSHQRALWGERGDVEMLDLDHPVLKISPGLASRRWRS